MNGSDLECTGKYAVAGGNLEIIHLCEQYHSSFEGSYEAAIKLHKNEIFEYIYENNLEENSCNINYLGCLCVKNMNYDIFTYLQGKGMKIDENIINEAARNGNLYLVQHFQKENSLPFDILVSSTESGNIELVKYILEQEGIDINAQNENYINKLMIQNYNWEIFVLFNTALIISSTQNYIEIVQLLLEQKGIDINTQRNKFFNHLIFQRNIWKLF